MIKDKKSNFLGVRISQELREGLEDARGKQSISDILRKLLNIYILNKIKNR